MRRNPSGFFAMKGKMSWHICSMNYESYLKEQVMFVSRECLFLLLPFEANVLFTSVAEKDGGPGMPQERSWSSQVSVMS